MRGVLRHAGAAAGSAGPAVRPTRTRAVAAGQSVLERRSDHEAHAAHKKRFAELEQMLERLCHRAMVACAAQLQPLPAAVAAEAVSAAVSAEVSAEAVASRLDALYEDLEELFMSRHGYVVSRKEQRLIEASGGSATYGELQPEGIEMMLDLLCGEEEGAGAATAADGDAGGHQRVFMDLGSGLGRVVLQAALSPRTRSPRTGRPHFDRFVGLELSPSRLEQSLHVLDRLKELAPSLLPSSQHPAGDSCTPTHTPRHHHQTSPASEGSPAAAASAAVSASQAEGTQGAACAQREGGEPPAAAEEAPAEALLSRVWFGEEDVTESDQVLDATHVFMCSTAFGSVACRRIVERLHHSQNFQVLVTSRELPFQDKLLKLGDVPHVPMSWNQAGALHVYVRRDLRCAPPHLLRRFCTSTAPALGPDHHHDGYNINSNAGSADVGGGEEGENGNGNGAPCAVAWLPFGAYGHLPMAAQEPVEGWRVKWLPGYRWQPQGGAATARSSSSLSSAVHASN